MMRHCPINIETLYELGALIKLFEITIGLLFSILEFTTLDL